MEAYIKPAFACHAVFLSCVLLEEESLLPCIKAQSACLLPVTGQLILLLNCMQTLCTQQEEPAHGRGVCGGEGVEG